MHTRELLDYAEELGDRFPDMPDWHVIESCGDFAEREIDIDSYIGYACIIAYAHRDANKASSWLNTASGLTLA